MKQPNLKYEKVPQEDQEKLNYREDGQKGSNNASATEVDLSNFQSGSRTKSGSRNNSPYKTSSAEGDSLVRF